MGTAIDKNVDLVIYKTLTNIRATEYAKEKKSKPKESDYTVGNFTRYFLRQVNNSFAKIIEIDKEQFNKFKTEPFYINVDILWKITGDAQSIINTNLKIIIDADKKLPGIKDLLQNKLLEFAKLS